MVHIRKLSYDVLDSIMSHLAEKDLITASLVSRSFWLAVVPIMYQTIVFDKDLAKKYLKTLSPFRAVRMRSEVALSVRVCGITALPSTKSSRALPRGVDPPDHIFLEECIVAIKLCSKLVKFYLDPSVFAPFLPTASSLVMSMPFTMPPYLSALEGKERLEDIRVNAFLNGRGLAGQMEALSKLHGLRRVTLDYASTDLLDVLPVWASSNMEMLKHLGIMSTPNLNPNILSRLLVFLPNLTSLSIASCEGVDCLSILRVLHFTPKLESLAIMIMDGEKIPSEETYLGVKNLHTLTLSFACAIGFPFERAMTLLTNLKNSGAALTSLTICKPRRTGNGMLSHPFIEYIVKSFGNSITELAFYGTSFLLTSLPVICDQCTELQNLSMSFPYSDTANFAYMIEKAKKLHTLINTDINTMLYQGGRRNNSLRTDVDYIMDIVQNVMKIVHSGLVFERRFLDGRTYIVKSALKPALGVDPDKIFYTES